MRVEVLYIDGCPNRQPTLDRIKEVLQEFRLTAEVLQVPVTDSGSALVYRFLGSPTVRVNGIDVEPLARTSTQFGLACRTYWDGVNWHGVPSVDIIRRALKQAQLPKR